MGNLGNVTLFSMVEIFSVGGRRINVVRDEVEWSFVLKGFVRCGVWVLF